MRRNFHKLLANEQVDETEKRGENSDDSNSSFLSAASFLSSVSDGSSILSGAESNPLEDTNSSGSRE